MKSDLNRKCISSALVVTLFGIILFLLVSMKDYRELKDVENNTQEVEYDDTADAGMDEAIQEELYGTDIIRNGVNASNGDVNNGDSDDKQEISDQNNVGNNIAGTDSNSEVDKSTDDSLTDNSVIELPIVPVD